MTSTFTLDLESALADLTAARAGLVSAVQPLSAADLDRARPGGWPVRRILEHLIQYEWLYAQGAAHLSGAPAPHRGPTACAGQPADEILCLLEASRTALLQAIAGVSEDAFYEVKRLGQEEYSVLSLLEKAASHDREHAREIRTIAGSALKVLFAALLAAATMTLLACGGGGDSEVSLTLTADTSQLAPGTTAADELDRTAETLRARATLYGAEDAQVTVKGDDQLLLTLKGIKEGSALQLFTRPGVVEFKRPQISEEALVICKTLQGEQFGVPPSNVNPDDASGSLARCFSLDKLGEPVWVAIEVVAEDGSTSGFTAEQVETGGWELRNDNTAILVRFTPDGAILFEKITGTLAGYPLGIFVDGTLVAAPRIQRAVTDGNALISGFQPENARILAAILNSGPLPLPLAQSTP